mgnify:CR=1 FL=1
MSMRWRDRYPVGGLPAGLLSWYAPGQRPVALVTFWMAMIGGEQSRLRAAWPGRRDPRSLFWSGGDFVLNVPDGQDLTLIRGLVDRGILCFDIEQDLGMLAAPASQVEAPRLRHCPVQIECARGRVDTEPHEPEVTGEVIVMHCKDTATGMTASPDLDALQPFRGET